MFEDAPVIFRWSCVHMYIIPLEAKKEKGKGKTRGVLIERGVGRGWEGRGQRKRYRNEEGAGVRPPALTVGRHLIYCFNYIRIYRQNPSGRATPPNARDLCEPSKSVPPSTTSFCFFFTHSLPVLSLLSFSYELVLTFVICPLVPIKMYIFNLLYMTRSG